MTPKDAALRLAQGETINRVDLVKVGPREVAEELRTLKNNCNLVLRQLKKANLS